MPFAGGHDTGRLAEAHRVAEQKAHGAARIGERGFAAAVAGQIGALQAGELSGGIGDDAEKRGPGLARRFVIGTVIAGGMKTKAGPGRRAVMPRPRR